MRISDWALYAFMVLFCVSAALHVWVAFSMHCDLLDVPLFARAVLMWEAVYLVYVSPSMFRLLVSSIRRRRSYEIGLFPTRGVSLHDRFIREREFFRWLVAVCGIVHLLAVMFYFLSAGVVS